MCSFILLPYFKKNLPVSKKSNFTLNCPILTFYYKHFWILVSAVLGIRMFMGLQDPDPHPSLLYGSRSGSFHHQAKKVRKTLVSTVLWLLYDFFYIWRSKRQRTKKKNKFFVSILKATEEKSRIRIRIKMSRIHSTACMSWSRIKNSCDYGSGLRQFGFVSAMALGQILNLNSLTIRKAAAIFLSTTFSSIWSKTCALPVVCLLSFMLNFPSVFPRRLTCTFLIS